MRELWLLLHFVGLGISLGAAVSILVLAGRAKGLSSEQLALFLKQVRVLTFVGPLGLLLLIVSGLLMLGPVWAAVKTNGLFHTKLTLVVILFFWIGFQHMSQARARKSGAAPKLPSTVTLLVGPTLSLVIIVLAVLVFK